MGEELYKNFDSQWLEMIDVPASVLNSKGIVVWFNKAAVNHFCFKGVKCNFYIKSINEGPKYHCEDGLVRGCLFREFIDDFITCPDFKRKTYKGTGKIWELIIKHFNNNLFLVYGIEYTHQKIAEILFKKYTVNYREKAKVQFIDKLSDNIDFNNIFRKIAESLFLPVVVFQNGELAFMNRSFIDFAKGDIKNISGQLKQNLDLVAAENKSKNPQEISFRYKKNNRQIKKECIVMPFNNNIYAVVFATDSKNPNIYHDMNNQELNQSKLGLNILYVEDKPINQKVFTFMLENKGCNVDVATNGQESIEMAEKKQYDVIFMDLQMPVMDGLTAAKTINKVLDNPPPIIALTAYYDVIDISEIKANGIVDVVSKPFNFQEIIEKLARWTKKK